MGVRNAISDILHIRRTIQQIVEQYQRSETNQILSRNNRLEYFIRTQYLKEKAYSSEEHGITSHTMDGVELIVSLTTYGKRIHEVYLAIESIMQNTIKPNKIILWLSEDEFRNKDLPIVLKRQMQRGLQVEYCKDLRSYKKIIPVLKMYPDACIITCDDDLIYESDLLEHLLSSYKEHPKSVSACRTHVMKMGKDGSLLGYYSWDYEKHEVCVPNLNFLTTGAGTLFPPHILPAETLNEKVFLSICPTADDVWINAMLRYNHIDIIKAYTHRSGGDDYYVLQNEYETPLWHINSNPQENNNDVQIKKVFEKYGIFEILREQSN